MESNSSVVMMSVLKKAFETDKVENLENDSEFSMALGIVAYFIGSKNKNKIKNKIPKRLNYYRNAKVDTIKDILKKNYKESNAFIDIDDKPFNKLMSMIIAYEPTSLDYNSLELGLITNLKKL